MTPQPAITPPPRESNVVPFQRRGADGELLPAEPLKTRSAEPPEVTHSASAERAGRRRKGWLRECTVIAISYAINGLCLSLFALTGTVHWTVGLVYAVPGWTVTAVGALLVAQNRTVKFKDPSLTLPHSAAAMVICVIGMALYPQINFAYGLFLFAVFLTVTYRMPRWQANTAWLVASLLVAGVTMGLGKSLHVPSASTGEQLIAWVCFVVMLGRCVLLSLINTSNTNLLRQRGKQMAETLAQIERLANYDELTGVLNRRSLLRILDDEQAHSDRNSTPTSVAIFDLDRFKVLNDTLGHLAGDRALHLFASSVQQHTRSTDRFGRYGGEEFLMIFTNTDTEKAEVAIERIRASLTSVDWSPVAPGFNLTFSAGVASYHPGETPQQLLSRADQGLYGAKHAGRNCTRAG